ALRLHAHVAVRALDDLVRDDLHLLRDLVELAAHEPLDREDRVGWVRDLLPAPGPPARGRRHDHDPVIRLALGSIALGVGATAIATSHGDAWLAVIVWLAIAVINVAYAFRR